MKKLELVICEENQLIRDMTRVIPLYESLTEHVIDRQRLIQKIGKFTLDETYSAFESG